VRRHGGCEYRACTARYVLDHNARAPARRGAAINMAHPVGIRDAQTAGICAAQRTQSSRPLLRGPPMTPSLRAAGGLAQALTHAARIFSPLSAISLVYIAHSALRNVSSSQRGLTPSHRSLTVATLGRLRYRFLPQLFCLLRTLHHVISYGRAILNKEVCRGGEGYTREAKHLSPVYW